MVRIFNLPKGDKLYTFKRGIHQAEAYWLSFSYKSNLIIFSTSSGTIHLFKMSEKNTGG